MAFDPHPRSAPHPFRLVPFWRESKRKNYFDGLIRDAMQLRRAWRYTWVQCRRHGVGDDPAKYAHTRKYCELDDAVRWARERDALLEHVRYKRYEDEGRGD